MLKARFVLFSIATLMCLIGSNAYAFSKACVYLQADSVGTAQMQVVSDNWASRWSVPFEVGQTQCVSLDKLNDEDHFVVQVKDKSNQNTVLCAPHRIVNVETPISAVFIANEAAQGVRCSNFNGSQKNILQTNISVANIRLTAEEINQFNDLIEAPEVNVKLSSVEQEMLDVAKQYLAGVLSKKNALERLISMETQTLKFALDSDQVQILRETLDDYVRFGFFRGSASLELMGQPSAFVELNDKDVVPNASALVDSLHANGTPVVAVLGKARIGSPEAVREAIKVASKAMDTLYLNREVAFVTGGYKGALDDVYGYTRIGYERAKDLEAYTLVVVPEAGINDSHQFVDAKDVYGKMWGDDTPALVGVSDAAMVFAWYGSWTKIEIDTLLHQKKKVVVVNPFQKEDEQILEIKMKKGIVKSYRNPEVAAQALLKQLPTKEALKASAPKDVDRLPLRDDALSEVEYFPFSRWSNESGEQTATSLICRTFPCESVYP